ncbi:hypothetical protein [Olivibacter jilunii]|uniref:hypothetical protein n=1 Tax=Olivibacter jilunii TaxID=985016 RepID=UPI003F1439DB
MAANYKWNIVIGASAGGLAPLITFFDHTPHDGAAYLSYNIFRLIIEAIWDQF